MPRYYCDYCDTYLTHDSPSVRKQHNAGYKHKAAVRDYYMQFEAQQNQYLIDLKIKQRMQQVGQAAAYPQVGPVYNQMMRPQLSAIPTPVMPGTPQMYASNPGMRPPVLARPGFAPGPGMPQMAPVPTGTPLPGQGNGLPPRPMTMNPPGPPPLAPGAPPPSTGAPPMFTSAMYQANPAAPTIGGFDSSNMNNQAQAPEASR